MAFKDWLTERTASLLSSNPALAMFWARVLPPSVMRSSIPWTSIEKPASESVLGVISVAGLYRASQNPFRTGAARLQAETEIRKAAQAVAAGEASTSVDGSEESGEVEKSTARTTRKRPRGDPTFRALEVDTPFRDLAFAGSGLAESTKRKVGAELPLDVLRELPKRKQIARLHGWVYSFMTHISGRALRSLTTVSARAVAKALKHDQVDLVLVLSSTTGGDETAGLIAREIEYAGIPTIALSRRPDAIDAVRPPRVVVFEGKGKRVVPWSRKAWRTHLNQVLEKAEEFEEAGQAIGLDG